MDPIPEADWKYLRSVKDEMLESLCRRINDKASKILTSTDSNYERFLRLYKHLDKGNKSVANCFDDWRRSTAFVKMVLLRREKLLTDDRLSQLSTETRNKIRMVEDLNK
jgi:hypothetical protein